MAAQLSFQAFGYTNMETDLAEVGKTKIDVAALEAALLPTPQMSIQYVHTFAPGTYVREARVPAGMIGIGHEHKTANTNVVLKGRLRIIAGDSVIEMKAPCVFVAEAGARKVAHFLEDTIWLNLLPNPDNETDPAVLEERFVFKSAAFIAHELEQKLRATEDQMELK